MQFYLVHCQHWFDEVEANSPEDAKREACADFECDCAGKDAVTVDEIPEPVCE